MLRVLVYAPRPRIAGGAERYTMDLLRQLSRSPRISQADVAYVGEEPPAVGGYDLVHGMDVLPSRVSLARRAGRPVVLTCHTAPWQSARQGWRTGRRLPWYRLGQLASYSRNLSRTAFAATRADAIIAVSRNTFDGLRLQVPWAKGKIHLVENGVDSEQFPVGRADEGYALFVGRLSTVKGIDVAVEAFAQIGRPLLVVGTGPLEESLRAKAPRGVTFLGNRSDPEVAKLYRGASVSVFPSQSEGYPFVVLEALSSGSPVISTQSFQASPPVSGQIRWLPFGVCSSAPNDRPRREALVKQLAEAVEQTWATKNAGNARERHEAVKRHNSWAGTVDSIIDVYEAVAARR